MGQLKVTSNRARPWPVGTQCGLNGRIANPLPWRGEHRPMQRVRGEIERQLMHPIRPLEPPVSDATGPRNHREAAPLGWPCTRCNQQFVSMHGERRQPAPMNRIQHGPDPRLGQHHGHDRAPHRRPAGMQPHPITWRSVFRGPRRVLRNSGGRIGRPRTAPTSPQSMRSSSRSIPPDRCTPEPRSR